MDWKRELHRSNTPCEIWQGHGTAEFGLISGFHLVQLPAQSRTKLCILWPRAFSSGALSSPRDGDPTAPLVLSLSPLHTRIFSANLAGVSPAASWLLLSFLLSLPPLGRGLLHLLSNYPSGIWRQRGNYAPLPAFSLLLLRLSWPTSQGLPECPCTNHPGAAGLSGSGLPTSSLHRGALNRTQHTGGGLATAAQQGKTTFLYLVHSSGLSPAFQYYCPITPNPSIRNALVILVQLSWEEGRDRSRQYSLPCRTWSCSILGNVSRLSFLDPSIRSWDVGCRKGLFI